MGQAVQFAFDTRVDLDLDTSFSKPRPARVGVPDTDVRLAVYQNLSEVETEWRAFQEAADCTVFQSFEWLATWQRHVGSRRGTRPAVVVGRNAAGTLHFIFPLAIECRGLVRHLTWLGTDLCDYNAPLLAPDFARDIGAARFPEIWQAVVRLLQADPDLRYDLISFSKMPENIGDQENPFLSLGADVHPSGAYMTRLGDNWDTFYTQKRSADTRRRDRTKRKKLSEFGEVRFRTAGADDTGPTFDILVEQKVRSFAHMGVGNLFARPGYREFFRALATGNATRHLVHVSSLDVGATRAAVNLGLIFRGCYSHVLASYDGGEVSKYGPGAAHLHELMRYAIERNCSVFDFTIGDERYKRDWCEGGLRLFDHVAPATAKGWPVVIGALAFRRLKRWIKQTPAVWNAFTKARTLAKSLTR